MIKLGKIKIGKNLPPVVIVDLGINHSGSLDKAIYLSDLAIKNGAKMFCFRHYVETHWSHFFFFRGVNVYLKRLGKKEIKRI